MILKIGSLIIVKLTIHQTKYYKQNNNNRKIIFLKICKLKIYKITKIKNT